MTMCQIAIDFVFGLVNPVRSMNPGSAAINAPTMPPGQSVKGDIVPDWTTPAKLEDQIADERKNPQPNWQRNNHRIAAFENYRSASQEMLRIRRDAALLF